MKLFRNYFRTLDQYYNSNAELTPLNHSMFDELFDLCERDLGNISIDKALEMELEPMKVYKFLDEEEEQCLAYDYGDYPRFGRILIERYDGHKRSGPTLYVVEAGCDASSEESLLFHHLGCMFEYFEGNITIES